MLLSAVVPAVQNTAKQLGKGLSGLKALRQKAATERLQVAAAAGALEKDRNTLGQLLTQRRQLADRAVQDLATTNNRIKKLATEAVDLRSLISSLEEDGRRPEIRGAAPIVTNQIASAGAARSPALDDLRGRLSLPANGRLAATFGSSDGLGGRLAGIYLETLPGSAVTSPCDGKIMFAGPFRGYGPMLIISANGGYHVLLAGLTNIDGVVGQVVLAGEPLGRMGTGRPVQQGGVQRDPGMASGKRLYIEFRRNSVPVDPVPWFAALRERVSG
jgi:septal ring factor EnvC (AmiA/AmiB activator)